MEPHQSLDLPAAPQWGAFLGQFGRVGIIITIVGCVLALVLSLIGKDKFNTIRRYSFYLACAGVVCSFLALATLFVKDQFQYEYIFNHSAHENPFSYKVASVWTGQQGSFLIWALFSAICGALTVAKSGEYERWYTAVYVTFLGVLAGILYIDTPFELLKDVVVNGKVLMPPDGNGMVPGLQNYWVIIHPPIIFLGFGGLTVPFAYGVAAMLNGNTKDWIKLCRAPALVVLSILGLGISLGGLWAYETQGWGGFWGWDPVENVSLVPWLFLVALSHGLIVQNVRNSWSLGNLFMAGVPFLSFVYGTFLTRSGLLDKVSNHSFASMQGGALSILRTFLWVVVLGYMALFTWRALKLRQTKVADPTPVQGFNRESFYLLGALSLCLMSFVIALGMSWPVITALIQSSAQKAVQGEMKAVDAGVYHKAIVWFFAATMLAMAIAPYVSWKRSGLGSILGRFITMASLAIGSIGFFWIFAKNPNWGVGMEPGAKVSGPFNNTQLPLTLVISVLLFFCFFAAYSNFWRAIELAKRSKLGIGPFIAHFGIAVLLSGLIISKGLERTEQTLVSRDASGSALDYKIEFKSMDVDNFANRSNTIKFDVTDPRGRTHVIEPNMYFVSADRAQEWPFIERQLSHDMYFFMHKPEVQMWQEPMALVPGETKVNDDIKIKYLEMTRVGEPGQDGTMFGAKLEVTYTNKDTMVSKTFTVNPVLTMQGRDLIPSFEPVGGLFKIGLIPGMDVATKSFQVQAYFNSPVFPFQVFYKPLTCLVWIGTGVFTLGGFISAFYRRIRRKAPEGDFVAKTAKIDTSN